MNIFEIFKELLSYSKEEIQFVLIELMLKDKIDFVELSNAYTSALNTMNKDSLNKLVEAEVCVCESFLFNKTKFSKDKDNYNHTQRCLRLLNNSNRFQMNMLNEEYEYNEEIGKQMSHYKKSC